MKIPAAELISKLFAETERKRTGSNGFTASLNINKGGEPNKILRQVSLRNGGSAGKEQCGEERVKFWRFNYF